MALATVHALAILPLAALAHASLPDETWWARIYAAADLDDVILSAIGWGGAARLPGRA